MPDQSCTPTIRSIPNGQSAPRYAEGQVVRAADLTLDRAAHDAELWRMRRYLHGWGVVAGLVVEPLTEDRILLHRGYGICPSGAEILLPEDVRIDGVVADMLRVCGPAAPGCALDAAATDASGIQDPVTVWLVIRPETVLADLRPAWPEGCGHPGNHLAPARECRGVALELRCALPEGHAAPLSDCDAMRAVLCGNRPVFMPDDLPDPGVLVLAEIRWDGAALSVDTALRRPLLPVSLLQDFVMACGCRDPEPERDDTNSPVPADPDPADPVPADPVPADTPDTGPPMRPEQAAQMEQEWRRVLDLAEQKKWMVRDDPVPDPADPVSLDPLIPALVVAKVMPEAARLLAPEVLAAKTGLTVAQASELAIAVGSVQNRLGNVRF